MGKYTEKELKEIQNLLLEENYEYDKRIINYIKDESLKKKILDYNRI